MTIYYVVFCVLFLCAFLESINVKCDKHAKNYVLSVFFVIFIILSTIYYGPGGDLYKYEWYFSVVEFEHLIDPIEPFENGYILLNALLRVFTSEYWVLRLVQALIVIGLWKIILLNRKDNLLEGREFVALLCLWSLKQGNILIVRSSIAVVLCIYAVKYIQSKELKKFLICLLVAFQFHSMVIVFLPAYWLYHKINSRKKLYITMTILVIISSLLPNMMLSMVGFIPYEYFQMKLLHYINDVGQISYTTYSYEETLIRALLNMGTSVIMLQMISVMTKQKNYEFEGFFNLYLFGTIIYFVTINVSTGLTRAALPFMDMQMLLLPQIFNIPFIKGNARNGFCAFVIFSIYLFLRMYVNIKDVEYITMFQ